MNTGVFVWLLLLVILELHSLWASSNLSPLVCFILSENFSYFRSYYGKVKTESVQPMMLNRAP